MGKVYDPKYDEDEITFGYLKKVLGDSITNYNKNNSSNNTTFIKNYGITPVTPYSKGDTWTTNNKIYKCIKSRDIGSFNMNDWSLIYDKETNEIIHNNFQFLSSLNLPTTREKVEVFYQETEPSLNWKEEELENRLGDYYQNSVNYKTYIYSYSSEKGYYWKEEDVVSIIFDSITGHRNIFLKKPMEYKNGDIWRINNTNDIELFKNVSLNDFMKCNNSNTNFDLNDWERITNELSIKGSLYSNDGILISSGNILSNLQYVSSGQYHGYNLLGFNKYFGVSGASKNYSDISIEVDLPDNFQVISAFLTIFHTPVYWNYYDENTGNVGSHWGYSRNIKLYKMKEEKNFKLYMAYANEYRYEINNSDLEEIPNAFKSNSFNPSNTNGTSIEKKSTFNIKDSLNKIGKTKLVIRSGDSIPTTDSIVAQKTGMARAVIDILGYVNTKEVKNV